MPSRPDCPPGSGVGKSAGTGTVTRRTRLAPIRDGWKRRPTDSRARLSSNITVSRHRLAHEAAWRLSICRKSNHGRSRRESRTAAHEQLLQFCVALSQGDSMKQPSEYRLHAQECRTLARNAQTEEQRTQLLKMAEAWDNFAAERERLMRTQDGEQNTGNN